MSTTPHMSFPATRLRRNRQAPWMREMLQEVRLHPTDLILPLFVQEGENRVDAVDSLPGVSRLSIDKAIETTKEARSLGIPAIALFPVIDSSLKTADGKEATNSDNLICQAIREIKKAVPNIGLIADVALDPYTSHGQDGIVENGQIDNDATLPLLCEQAKVQAAAGCDIVAPSDMMDGRIGAVRASLEQAGHINTAILAYTAKYASHLYGPFRDALGSSACLGKADKRTYQLPITSTQEALLEAALDISEGADMIMVKPATAYGDIIHQLATRFSVPVLAYQVSGEYAMIKAAAANGMGEEITLQFEHLIGIKRAGARAIISYAALEVARAIKHTTA